VLLLQVAGAAVLVAVVAVLLTKGTVALTSRLGGQRVSRILADAEYIIACHAVPPAWRKRLEKRLRGLRPDCADSRSKTRHRARARRWSLRELRRLIAFARTTSIVADEEAREILLSDLMQVEAEWRSRSWDAMCAPGHEDASRQ
jgi:hypothetical protein